MFTRGVKAEKDHYQRGIKCMKRVRQTVTEAQRQTVTEVKVITRHQTPEDRQTVIEAIHLKKKIIKDASKCLKRDIERQTVTEAETQSDGS